MTRDYWNRRDKCASNTSPISSSTVLDYSRSSSASFDTCRGCQAVQPCARSDLHRCTSLGSNNFFFRSVGTLPACRAQYQLDEFSLRFNLRVSRSRERRSQLKIYLPDTLLRRCQGVQFTTAPDKNRILAGQTRWRSTRYHRDCRRNK